MPTTSPAAREAWEVLLFGKHLAASSLAPRTCNPAFLLERHNIISRPLVSSPLPGSSHSPRCQQTPGALSPGRLSSGARQPWTHRLRKPKSESKDAVLTKIDDGDPIRSDLDLARAMKSAQGLRHPLARSSGEEESVGVYR